MTKTETALAPPEITSTLLNLEQGGALTPMSLTITDPDMTYEQWEGIGRYLGTVDRASKFWIGDWMNAGETLFGEESAQGVEATTGERFSETERVTGLAHQTLLNVSSVCRKVARVRRRVELTFAHHSCVSALEPGEQEQWLARAIEEGWSVVQLREAIAASKNPAEDPDDDPGAAPRNLSRCDQIEQALRVVFDTGQSTSDGHVLVPPESWSMVAAALGE